jgi:hypothetical protein
MQIAGNRRYKVPFDVFCLENLLCCYYERCTCTAHDHIPEDAVDRRHMPAEWIRAAYCPNGSSPVHNVDWLPIYAALVAYNLQSFRRLFHSLGGSCPA